MVSVFSVVSVIPVILVVSVVPVVSVFPVVSVVPVVLVIFFNTMVSVLCDKIKDESEMSRKEELKLLKVEYSKTLKETNIQPIVCTSRDGGYKTVKETGLLQGNKILIRRKQLWECEEQERNKNKKKHCVVVIILVLFVVGAIGLVFNLYNYYVA